LLKHIALAVKPARNNPKCNVTIEERPAPDERQREADMICKVIGIKSQPLFEPWVIWEPKQGHVRIDDVRFCVTKFVLDLLAAKDEKEQLDVIRDFFIIFGPIIKKKEVSLRELQGYIYVFFLTVVLFNASVLVIPEGTDTINDYLLKPLRRAQNNHPNHKGYWNIIEVHPFHKWGKAFFAPYSKEQTERDGYNFTFIAKSPPVTSDKEKLTAWAKKTTIQNINLILNRKLKYVAQFNSRPSKKTDKKVTITNISIVPEDIYTHALLEAIAGHQEFRTCDCGCGNNAPINSEGNAWYTPACYRRVNFKQTVLAMYRGRKNRGEITTDEYKAVKDLSNGRDPLTGKLLYKPFDYRQHFKTKENLINQIEKYLEQRKKPGKHPRQNKGGPYNGKEIR